MWQSSKKGNTVEEGNKQKNCEISQARHHMKMTHNATFCNTEKCPLEKAFKIMQIAQISNFSVKSHKTMCEFLTRFFEMPNQFLS